MTTEDRQGRRAVLDELPGDLLEVVRELVAELEPPSRSEQAEPLGRRPGVERVRFGASLGSDLGLDSLARAELVGRVERRYGVTLPERTLAEAESPSDLLRAVALATDGSGVATFDLARHAATEGEVAREGAPVGAWEVAGLQAAGLDPGQAVRLTPPTSPGDAQGVAPPLGAPGRRLGGVLYAVWFWAVLGLAGVPLWLAVWGLPVRALRRGAVRGVSRLLARLTGTRIRVEGLEHLEDRPGGPWVITSNHASYLDGFVLAAVLPSRAAYVVKSELRQSPVSHTFLRRIGCVFVERFDPSRGERELEKVAAALRRGDHLVIFPEGTLQRAPGLQPFRMGAFVVAARTGTPVVPVVVQGTRSKLRGGSWFPRPGELEVVVRPPVEAEGVGWRAAVRLRDRVREEMLARLEEPDLR